MNVPRLALRALNEYRRVSPFTYLALRYTLLSTAAQNDRWAKEIAPEILHRRDGPAYLLSRQFKGTKEGGSLEYRDIHFPCANEVLAEAALLAHCAKAGGPFSPTDDVFSYHLAPASSGEGSFKAYFKLFTARQAAIAKACRQWPSGIVLYADIRRFYPSVSLVRANTAWLRACAKAHIEDKWRLLGTRLIAEQRAVSKGLLVGPVFSHVLGNLVLLEFDEKMRSKYPNRYFRYVDDIALVIPEGERDVALTFIRGQLKRIKLRLNPEKTCHLSAREWQRAARYQALDYDGEVNRTDDKHWMGFVDRLKCYLIANPNDGVALARLLHDSGVRISIPHYLSTVQDAGYVRRFGRRIQSKSFQKSIAETTIQTIVSEAKALGVLYRQEYEQLWQAFNAADSMKRKWLISRLRYVLGRLILIAPEDDLNIYASELETQEDLAEYAAIFKALTTRDVSDLLRFSGKVNAGAGQALATMRRPVKCAPTRWSREAIEGYLILRLLGVDLAAELPRTVDRQCHVRFTNGVHDKHEWLKAPNGYLQELLALSGETTLERHRSLFQEPADPDERWVLFADEIGGVTS